MTFKIFHGDCLDTLKNAPDNSIDSIVTDPPYGLSFMGKGWDYDVPTVEIWKECLRVLKPGGHLLAFGGTRTYHRLVVAIEDAGFEIRDQIQWLYGQGFPKSMDISKAIDKAAGAERDVVFEGASGKGTVSENAYGDGLNVNFQQRPITAPATPEAKQWSGWGTALKPANEPICLARKPLSETTIAKNVLKHGTGGLNIDGGRIGTDEKLTSGRHQSGRTDPNQSFKYESRTEYEQNTGGRFPSNVILDEDAARVLDGQAAQSVSRFFYQAKASKAERNYGCENLPTVECGVGDDRPSGQSMQRLDGRETRAMQNTHPTVKPIKLMEYLVKLITPPGGKVLDPFMGSGTTGVAALRCGFEFRGIEREENYFYISQARLEKETV